jgi:hypothetical protein
MSRELSKLVIADLAARKSGWEDKQRIFYEMRHEGLRRRNKPFPGAADLHFPLTDGMIDKLKPFYFSQIFGQDLLASFVARDGQAPEATAAVAAWYDYQLKERSNFFDEVLALMDLMLMCGNPPMKVWWDGQQRQLCFDAIDPLFFVVPPGTKDLEKADRLTHIIQMSVGEYRRNKNYAQDAAVLRKIRGKGVADNDSGGKEDAKYEREGITYGENDEQVVLWETYENTPRGWLVHTYAPCNPDVEIRRTFILPSCYGLNGKRSHPFVDFPAEIKDKGFYAARGIVEKEGPFETYLSRVWNEKADAMSFLNRPMFTHEGPGGSLANIALVPGQMLPNNVKRVEMGNVPFDFDQEMNNTRMIAEYHAAMPDFGVASPANTKKARTATEVNQTTSLMTQTTDLRGWIFRRRAAVLYQKSFALLAHYAKEDLRYIVENSVQTLEPGLLDKQYSIQPEGTPDNWNRANRQQRAYTRLQTFANNPFVKQGELVKDVLNEEDPRLVRKLFEDPQLQMADQQEDQANEISYLLLGFPARVKPSDDDNVHLESLAGFVQMVMNLRTPITRLGLQRITEHAQGHVQKLATTDKQAAAQWQQRLAALSQQFMAAVGGGPAMGAEAEPPAVGEPDPGMMMPEGVSV